MASQNESDEKSRNDDTSAVHQQTRPTDSRGSDMESERREPEPFAVDDPLSAVRLDTLTGETAGLLSEIQTEPVGFDGADRHELAKLYEDAQERQNWSQARQDGFRAILRLAKPIPPRANRVL